MTRIAAPMLAVGLLFLYSQASAFGVVGAGVVHDVAVVETTPAGLTVLSSSDALMFGNMKSGDGPNWTLLISRIAAGGTVEWTRSGASHAWGAARVVGAPDDTAVVLGYDIAAPDVPPAYLARFDADGRELWNGPVNLGTDVADLEADASSVWAFDGGGPYARITRFSRDGDMLWQHSLATLTGCEPACDGDNPVALVVEGDDGIVALASTGSYLDSPANTLLVKISPDGTLVWQTSVEDLVTPRLARSASGALAVFGRVQNSDQLRVVVYGRDGVEAWRRAIDIALSAYVDDIAFDAAGNVYALSDTVVECTLDAFASDGTPRWSHPWTMSDAICNHASLSVGAPDQPMAVIAGSDAGEAAHGINADGTAAFDTLMPETSGYMDPLRRSADGARFGLDLYRALPQSMQLTKLSSDGTVAWSTLPGESEVPTVVGADDVAFHNDGGTTLLAVDYLGGFTAPREPFLAHFDSGGTEQWRVPLAGADPSLGVLRVSGSDMLLAFRMQDALNETHVQRRNADGDVAWETVADGSISDLAALPDAGSAVLTYLDNGDAELTRYDSGGANQWTVPLTYAPTLQARVGAGVQVVPARDDSLYAIGNDTASLPFVEKFDSHGAALWAKRYPNAAYDGRRRGIVEDENGTAFLAYDESTYPLSTTHLARLGADGTETWAIDFAGESISLNGRSLAPAQGGGVLLLTTYGVRRIGVGGNVVWAYAYDCTFGCYPVGIEQRDDGHVFALASLAQTWDYYAGPLADHLVELDENGSWLDAYTSHPPTTATDQAVSFRLAGADVLIAGMSHMSDSISRARIVRLEGGDALFADGFDDPPR